MLRMAALREVEREPPGSAWPTPEARPVAEPDYSIPGPPQSAWQNRDVKMSEAHSIDEDVVMADAPASPPARRDGIMWSETNIVHPPSPVRRDAFDINLRTDPSTWPESPKPYKDISLGKRKVEDEIAPEAKQPRMAKPPLPRRIPKKVYKPPEVPTQQVAPTPFVFKPSAPKFMIVDDGKELPEVGLIGKKRSAKKISKGAAEIVGKPPGPVKKSRRIE